MSAALAPRWQLADLVAWGMHHPEHERQRSAFIFVAEIYQHATRISSQCEEFESVALFMASLAREHSRAFCLLKRTDRGWVVADYGHCLGDRVDPNTLVIEARAS